MKKTSYGASKFTLLTMPSDCLGEITTFLGQQSTFSSFIRVCRYFHDFVKNPKIKSITFGENQMGNDGIANLRELTLEENEQITEDGLKTLVNLRKLDLGG